MTKPYNDRLERLEEAMLLRSHMARVMLYDCDRDPRRYELCRTIYWQMAQVIRFAVTPVVPVLGDRANVWPYFKLNSRRYRASESSPPAPDTSSQSSLPGLASDQLPTARRG